jgi:hypothetical protein
VGYIKQFTIFWSREYHKKDTNYSQEEITKYLETTRVKRRLKQQIIEIDYLIAKLTNEN